MRIISTLTWMMLVVMISTHSFAQQKTAPKKPAAPATNSQPAYIKYELDGDMISSTPKDVETYNLLQKESNDNRTSTIYQVQIGILSGMKWRMEIEFRVPPKTMPVVCKMPYSEKLFPKGGQQDSYIPSAALYLIDKDATHLYETEFLSPGNFAITKLENGWVEGIFDAELTSKLGHANVKITNGSSRFKVPKQLMERD
jgi:hypothetical protein